MGRIIQASIDLSRIDKKRIVEGKKGQKFYPIQISINDQPNEYGQDVAISDQQTKEEREAKVKRNYLGNGKTIWKSNSETPTLSAQSQPKSNDNFWD